MIKGHTDIDIWNTGFFINADYFSDDFIIYNNTGKDLTRKTLAHRKHSASCVFFSPLFLPTFVASL